MAWSKMWPPVSRKYIDCRDSDGWLTEDLECQIDTEPWCDYHYMLVVQGAIRHANDAKLHSERRHIVLCLLTCIPICTTVCLIVDRVLGG